MYAKRDKRSKCGILRDKYRIPTHIISDYQYKKLKKKEKQQWKRISVDINYVYKKEKWKNDEQWEFEDNYNCIFIK
jgi:hypothetical protein